MVGQELWRSGQVSAAPSPGPLPCKAITHSCLSWCVSNLMAASSHISAAQVTSDNLEGDLGTRIGNTPEINPTDAMSPKRRRHCRVSVSKSGASLLESSLVQGFAFSLVI